MGNRSSLILCSGAAHLSEALRILLPDIELFSVKKHSFTSGEFYVTIEKELSDKVYIIQSYHGQIGVSDLIVELMFAIDIASQYAKEIHLILPYMLYGRQDRQLEDHSSIGMRLFAKVFSSIDISSVLTIDIHSTSSIDFFNIPVSVINVMDIVASRVGDDMVVVLPDVGATNRMLRKDELEYVNISKTRCDGLVKMTLLGDVRNKDCIIIDDIIDSGKTACSAAHLLKSHGAKSVLVYATHGLLSGDAIYNLKHSFVNKLLVTNSIFINNDNAASSSFIEILDISHLIAKHVL